MNKCVAWYSLGTAIGVCIGVGINISPVFGGAAVIAGTLWLFLSLLCEDDDSE